MITETSFPNELQELANVSGHLTPADAGAGAARSSKQDVPVYLYGGKPKHLDAIKRQVKALKRKELQLLVQGKTYTF